MGRFFTSFSDLLTPSERERLAALKKSGIPQHVRDNLDRQSEARFLAALEKQKVTATLRREKGLDIDAACGQLRLKTEREMEGTASQ